MMRYKRINVEFQQQTQLSNYFEIQFYGKFSSASYG